MKACCKQISIAALLMVAILFRAAPASAWPNIMFPSEPTSPVYARTGSVTVDPEPPIPGRPTRVCANLVNTDSNNSHTATLHFGFAPFGIGLPITSQGAVPVVVSRDGTAQGCVIWVPPGSGNAWGIEVRLSQDGFPDQTVQRNLDLDGPLEPGVRRSLIFQVMNSSGQATDISLAVILNQIGWGAELSPAILNNMAPGETRTVTLTVTPPVGLPPDGTPVLDVEAYHGVQPTPTLLGGFRKTFRPPVILGSLGETAYARSGIFAQPYPTLFRRPMELGAEVRNTAAEPKEASVAFSYAPFGIGFPFTPINDPLNLTLPALGIARPSTIWLPPAAGNWCFQAEVLQADNPSVFSRQNLEFGNPLSPHVPNAVNFPVRNPLAVPSTVSLTLKSYRPEWNLLLSPTILPDMGPGEVRLVTLTVTPNEILPPDGTPVADVEAWAGAEWIGGIRKIYRPPVWFHRAKDPEYAAGEIGIALYPAVPGKPVQLSATLSNPTGSEQPVSVTFRVAPFGIGLPFNTDNLNPDPIAVVLPPRASVKVHTTWNPPSWLGKFCVEAIVQSPGYEPVRCRRNIELGERLQPGTPQSTVFPVGGGSNPLPVDLVMGLVHHLPGWQVQLTPASLNNVQPGETRPVTLTVTPPGGTALGTGNPIVDVEVYANHELLGGLRKLDAPPVSLHLPHEKFYAESEIHLIPYPPHPGTATKVGVDLFNTTATEVTVDLSFGWAPFGWGIPFSTTGLVPANRSVTLGPLASTAAEAAWNPTLAGDQCFQARLTDPDGVFAPQLSQRNVHLKAPPYGCEKVVENFLVRNAAPQPTVVEIGVEALNLPPGWTHAVSPTSLSLEPYQSAPVTVTMELPCSTGAPAGPSGPGIPGAPVEAIGHPVIRVEGYAKGQITGGIEIQFPRTLPGWFIYLPLIISP